MSNKRRGWSLMEVKDMLADTYAMYRTNYKCQTKEEGRFMRDMSMLMRKEQYPNFKQQYKIKKVYENVRKRFVDIYGERTHRLQVSATQFEVLACYALQRKLGHSLSWKVLLKDNQSGFGNVSFGTMRNEHTNRWANPTHVDGNIEFWDLTDLVKEELFGSNGALIAHYYNKNLVTYFYNIMITRDELKHYSRLLRHVQQVAPKEDWGCSKVENRYLFLHHLTIDKEDCLEQASSLPGHLFNIEKGAEKTIATVTASYFAELCGHIAQQKAGRKLDWKLIWTPKVNSQNCLIIVPKNNTTPKIGRLLHNSSAYNITDVALYHIFGSCEIVDWRYRGNRYNALGLVDLRFPNYALNGLKHWLQRAG